jgi:transposase
MAIIQLGNAFKNFFAGRASYPVFKKKGKSRDSFTLTNDQFAVDGSRAKSFLPRFHASLSDGLSVLALKLKTIRTYPKPKTKAWSVSI